MRVAPRRLAVPVDRAAKAAIVAIGLLALVAGIWGITASRGGDELARVGQVVDLPDGQMRVDRVIPWRRGGHAAMPGMTVSDPLPAGQRRFWVSVTLRAGDDGKGLAYRRASFSVSADTGPRIRVRAATDNISTIRPGAQATVLLLFQVPAKSTGLTLRAQPGTQPVALFADGVPGGGAHADEH